MNISMTMIIKMRRFTLLTFFITIAIIFSLPLLATSQPPSAPKNSLQAGDSLRIEEVIKKVLKNNDRIAAARFMEESAFANIGPAGAWDDPMLMAGVVNLPTTFDFQMDAMTMKMVGLSQNIPYSGFKGLRSKAARADAGASREQRRAVELDLATSAKLAFLDLYYRGLILDAIKGQHQLQEEIIASVSAKLKSGQADQADLAIARADLWRLDSDILSTQQEIESSRNNLLTLMGEDSDPLLPPLSEPSVGQLPLTAAEWQEKAKRNYPPLSKLALQSQSYRFQAAAAKRMRWPMLGLSADYGFRADSEMEKRDNMVGFQASISLPIFSGRQQGNMALSMEAMRRSSDAEAVQLWRDVKSELETLFSRAERLSQSLEIYQKRIVPAYENAYISASTGYAANRIPLTNLLSYSMSIYRDRITAYQIAFELASTMVEAEKYITNPDEWNADSK
ncbi:MAG: hypothetical protein CO189_01080 [candidate division Zixibacteria bacterium CG_4_9_14_3_um_filter_46_8]|nr:MAG: hypothetical protein CO189_01080 [candidate division Zixibacteria bacterium CG_4_9_14_3_um_filter_46_8]